MGQRLLHVYYWQCLVTEITIFAVRYISFLLILLLSRQRFFSPSYSLLLFPRTKRLKMVEHTSTLHGYVS